MKNKTLWVIHYVNALDGKTWINLWSLVAVIKFALGKPIDMVFLGVLGFYTGHTLGSKLINNTEAKTGE